MTDDRENARRAAAAHTEASRELEAFLRRAPEVPDPADIAEFTILLAREEEVRAERQDALVAFGLSAPSIDEP
ncbi:hypothetical protein Ais01nite_55080 [Asanoa ishikariensis]|uniref:Uncharacterized protein n=1 Tax=Asanoa ishikariensis TaxID=137265 RepID=A0A1H3TUD0_9ACTN|nr:hypothetical protein [Asanoa ishikariensis]GIF67473.1 hypothetical protein Ais01nite_55080 [Asanoa ishikariensis]SDZ53608.1 hypothetical protein SAMN05421684_6369 [Asanoa ishikariensis]